MTDYLATTCQHCGLRPAYVLPICEACSYQGHTAKGECVVCGDSVVGRSRVELAQGQFSGDE